MAFRTCFATSFPKCRKSSRPKQQNLRMEGQLIGRSPWLQSVNVDAKASQIGDIIKVRITGTGTNSLFAEFAEG